MGIPTLEYCGHELRAYSQQDFPTHHDPFAAGARRFSSFVRIAPLGQSGAVERYMRPRDAPCPATSEEALELGIQYGMDIIDGKIQGHPLDAA